MTGTTPLYLQISFFLFIGVGLHGVMLSADGSEQ